MSTTAQRSLDCMGLKCPAPIMQLARVSRELGSTPAALTIVSDDEAFAGDLKAWCRTRPDARVLRFDEQVGVFTAVISLNGGDGAAAPSGPRSVQLQAPPVNGKANGAAAAAVVASVTGAPHALALDCRGQKCPAPIMEIAKAARQVGKNPGSLTVVSDDDAFAADLKAWCRTRPDATLLRFDDKAGLFTAVIGLNGGTEASASAASQAVSPRASGIVAPAAPAAASADGLEVDCRGLKCPAPIMELARRTREPAMQGQTLRVVSTDGAFPNDVRAWARMSKATILSIDEGGGEIVATIKLAGEAVSAAPAGAAPVSVAAVAAPVAAPVASARVQAAPVASPIAAAGSADVLDCRGMQAPTPILTLSQRAFAMAATGGDVRVLADYPTFANDLMSWCQLTGNQFVGLAPSGAGMEATVRVAARPELVVQAPSAAPTVALATVPSPAGAEVPAEDLGQRCTLLLMHNDLDAALAAMLVATGAASQGMQVAVFFSFWGVNILRGDKLRALPPGEAEGGVGFLQSMMKLMMPKGVAQLKLSRMNMAGMGTWMMQHLMRKQNIMSLQQMMDACLELNVRFLVCTMSMELMGVSTADLVDLPNMEYLGVASFVTEARQSKMTMTF